MRFLACRLLSGEGLADISVKHCSNVRLPYRLDAIAVTLDGEESVAGPNLVSCEVFQTEKLQVVAIRKRQPLRHKVSWLSRVIDKAEPLYRTRLEQNLSMQPLNSMNRVSVPRNENIKWKLKPSLRLRPANLLNSPGQLDLICLIMPTHSMRSLPKAM